MGWILQFRDRNLFLFFVSFSTIITIMLLTKSDTNFRDKDNKNLVAHKLTELEMRVDQLTTLYDSKDTEIKEMMKHFSLTLRSITNSLNLTVLNAFETVTSAYDKSVEIFKTQMGVIDLSTFLPHLKSLRNGLRPLVLHSGDRHSVSIVFGIPTVGRQQKTYLISTLINLVNNMNEKEKKDSLIVVMIGETDAEYVQQVTKEIKNRLSNVMHTGLIDVIAPYYDYYPNFSKLRLTLGDSLERVRWRSKQNLDYVFLMMYCRPRGLFYVQLEDDVVSKPQFQSVMKNAALEKIRNSENWLILDFCRLGFIGKMIKCSDLPWIIQFIVMFYNDKPGDWLLDELVQTKACNREKDSRDCQKRKGEIWVTFKPSLFQHIGTKSSLNGKIQLLKDSNFRRKFNKRDK
ncbi:alpha-1,3-mannosyl-glycoprotein 4-beta-N-acetylglucosaminyltransferase B-like isoform X2 [Adelges cooleyi]|nr:alpha-1,3-mannosyl-glycoprotein 4-beta-N-acetylglucosaminyltransferase B-like isoform X2 [Adelges cooleyi]XP_050424992.1 alpha-1,3-mannosyl-glycoprotein 4-beta-N-acetylglucosaminyltransferase B-like isoform X2 [Adelges cooleyi]XP_050424993.1 alpha-1,3-mannosyl-glycoprotein 4-beta-N-acetylglucosaminyltransferase B-like isoform X2 [Adelges cooleyi]XP_050424994.1 alpha-1,3-mannosyl-glycoprotein 4-beta-N-acetylglucosaminyltransferase B-like isoform X2 [Adelges cooleyi]XP_050424995.1 alpha-1,3-ma